MIQVQLIGDSMLKEPFAILLVSALMAVSTISCASEPDENFTYIDLNASVKTQVPNDLMRVQLYIESTGDNPKSIGIKNTKSLNSAVESLKSQGFVITIGNRVMSPHYKRISTSDGTSNQPDGWTERLEFSASSSDFGSLSLAIAKLDGDIKMQGLSFSVSPSLLASEEEELTAKAIESFNKKALMIAKGMGAQQYSVVSLNVPEAGTQYPVRPMMRMAAMTASEEVGMATEGGKTTLVQSITGKISINKNTYPSIE